MRDGNQVRVRLYDGNDDSPELVIELGYANERHLRCVTI